MLRSFRSWVPVSRHTCMYYRRTQGSQGSEVSVSRSWGLWSQIERLQERPPLRAFGYKACSALGLNKLAAPYHQPCRRVSRIGVLFSFPCHFRPGLRPTQAISLTALKCPQGPSNLGLGTSSHDLADLNIHEGVQRKTSFSLTTLFREHCSKDIPVMASAITSTTWQPFNWYESGHRNPNAT